MLFHNTFLKKTFEKIGQVEQKRRNIGLKKLYTADEQYLKVTSFRKIQQKTVLWSFSWSFCSLIRNGLCRNGTLTLLKHCGMILTEDRTNQSKYPINSVEMTFLFCSWKLISHIDFHTCYHQLRVCYIMHACIFMHICTFQWFVHPFPICLAKYRTYIKIFHCTVF